MGAAPLRQYTEDAESAEDLSPAKWEDESMGLVGSPQACDQSMRDRALPCLAVCSWTGPSPV